MAPKLRETFNTSVTILPVLSAAFFQDCISEQDLDEMNIEIIRNTLYKVRLRSAVINKINQNNEVRKSGRAEKNKR